MRIRLDNLRKRYGPRTVVQAVSLEIRSGELFALLGPSGSGKSTLVGMVAGLIRPDEGRIVLGDRVANDPAVRIPAGDRSVGMVFQELALWPHMTAAKHLRFVAPRSDPLELLTLLEIGHLAGAKPGTLSGGEAQRLAIARAVATRPNVLLLDEPLGPLDRRLKERMLKLIREVHDGFKTTTVMVTHDYSEAFRIADRVGVMVDGALVQAGTPSEVYGRPESLEVAELTGPVVTLAARPEENGAVRSVFGRHELIPGAGSRAGNILLRPEQMEIVPDEHGPGRVVSCRAAGSGWDLRIDVQGQILDATSPQQLLRGMAVRIGLPRQVWLVP